MRRFCTCRKGQKVIPFYPPFDNRGKTGSLAKNQQKATERKKLQTRGYTKTPFLRPPRRRRRRLHRRPRQLILPAIPFIQFVSLLLTPSLIAMEVVADASGLPLPESFIEFLNQNGLDPSIYAASHSTPRYIRCYSLELFYSLRVCVCVFCFFS